VNKTKLGITTGILSVILFLSGLSSFLIMVLVAGYILIFEGDEKLRKNAVKAVFFILGIVVISSFISILNDVLGAINALGRVFSANAGSLRIPLGLDTLLREILAIVEKVGILLFAYKSRKGDEVNIPVIDDVVKKLL
jgi:uncharacterized membrane protein